MSRRLTWSLVLGVALSLAALIASSDQDAIASLLRHDIASLVLKVVLVVFVGGLVAGAVPRDAVARRWKPLLFWA